MSTGTGDRLTVLADMLSRNIVFKKSSLTGPGLSNSGTQRNGGDSFIFKDLIIF